MKISSKKRREHVDVLNKERDDNPNVVIKAENGDESSPRRKKRNIRGGSSAENSSTTIRVGSDNEWESPRGYK